MERRENNSEWEPPKRYNQSNDTLHKWNDLRADVKRKLRNDLGNSCLKNQMIVLSPANSIKSIRIQSRKLLKLPKLQKLSLKHRMIN